MVRPLLVHLAVDMLLVNPFPTQFTKVGRTRRIAYYTKTPWVAPLGPVLAHIRWSWGIPLCHRRIDSISGSLTQEHFIFLRRV